MPLEAHLAFNEMATQLQRPFFLKAVDIETLPDPKLTHVASPANALTISRSDWVVTFGFG